MPTYGEPHWRPKFEPRQRVWVGKKRYRVVARGPLKHLGHTPARAHPDSLWKHYLMGYVLEDAGGNAVAIPFTDEDSITKQRA